MPSSDFVDWTLAGRVGRAVAGTGVSVARQDVAAIIADFRKHVERADALVRDYTGLMPLYPTGPASVLSRGGWIDANLDAIRAMMRPLSERLGERMGSGIAKAGVRRMGGAVVGLQMGLLLGYISQKVLGQYDLLLATGEPGRVYFVGPNIVAVERQSNLDTHDFRLWIALHEVTHRTQFLAVPWLKEHVSGLVEQYLSGVTVDADRMKELAGRLRKILAGGPDEWRQANIVSVFLSGEQREAIDRMQSLMSVVEGHGNFVMDGVAEKELPSFSRMREALNARRAEAGAAERALQRLIALDMKYQQYAVGQSFFDDVERLGGMQAVNLVWERPENLPSPGELRDAGAWLSRVRPQPSLFDEVAT